jgi:acetone carboxylase gamma subunit
MRPIGRYLEIKKEKGEDVITCSKCGFILGPVHGNYKEHAVHKEEPLQKAGAHFPPQEETRFVLHEYYCPNCAIMLEVDINLAGEPALWDIQLD